MVTSFFGSHSFGGDSVYVERLSQGLVKQGHEVHVAFSPGAFDAVKANTKPRKCELSGDLRLHWLSQGKTGVVNSIWSHQTCRPGSIYNKAKKIFNNENFDVVHFHNISLLGAAGLMRLAGRLNKPLIAVTVHDYWWLCSQSLYWKYNRAVCESEDCVKCNLKRGIPPQFWRFKGWFNKVLSNADIIFFPSRSASEIYRSQGFEHPDIRILPGILPEDWGLDIGEGDNLPAGVAEKKPFLAAAGRLVPEKGFHQLIKLMKQVPQLNLVIAGDGPIREELQALARKSGNVFFTGLISNREVRAVFREARAVIVPSLFPETFGLVAAEALGLRVPVIARKSGSLPELIEATSGGDLFDSEAELLSLLKKYSRPIEPAGIMSESLDHPLPDIWFEDAHVGKYISMIKDSKSQGKRFPV